MDDDLKSSVKFTDHLFDGSGNNIMNSIQYTSMCIVPLLLVNNLLETQLPVFSQVTPPVTLAIEIAIHLIILLIVLYFVDRIVRFFPSVSGDKYGNVSFETIGLLLVLLVVNSHNSNLGKKLLHMTRHVKERFIGREGMDVGSKSDDDDGKDVPPPHPLVGGTAAAGNAPPTPPPPPPPPPPKPKPKPTKEAFEPSSSLEGFAIGGGNYSLF